MKREPQDTATTTTFTLDPEAGPSGTECGCRRDYCLSGSVATFGWASWPEPVWQRNRGGRQAPGERPEFAGGLPVVDTTFYDGSVGAASCLEDSGRSDVLTALKRSGMWRRTAAAERLAPRTGSATRPAGWSRRAWRCGAGPGPI